MNKHLPKFVENYVYVDYFTESTSSVITSLYAEDLDAENCPDDVTAPDCTCGAIVYSIEKGNEDGLFEIDPSHGFLSLASDAKLDSKEYALVITARNPTTPRRDDTMKTDDVKWSIGDSCLVYIDVKDRKEENRHNRARRSVSRYVVTINLKND